MKSYRKLVRAAVLIALASACLFVAPDRLRSLLEPTALAATLVVNTTDDSDDGACNAAHCSLREAINAANANAAGDTINFNIPGSGVHTITLASALPTITGAVTLDGYSQPGAAANTLADGDNAVLLIELNGAGAGNVDGVVLAAGSGGSIVKGLVINRFGSDGIVIHSSNTIIQGNFIGTDPTGTIALGNGQNGLVIAGGENNFIGIGSVPAARNLIGDNSYGIQITSGATLNKVQGNFIGTAADGKTPLGNSSTGVFLTTGSSDNLIGGLVDGSNVIAFNGTGVLHNGSGTGNALHRNSIHSNGKLGIDISSPNEIADVTANDEGDTDTGPNDIQNFPVITTSGSSGGTTTVVGTLNSTPSTQFRIEVFSNPSCDPSGYGEGRKFNAGASITTNASGNQSFLVQFPTSELSGPYVTATATDPSGNTSEFSRCVAADDQTFTVNSTADTNDGACTTATNGCTLREAITAANQTVDLDQIKFNIPGSGVRTINVVSALPALTHPVIIDGYTQPNSVPNTNPASDNSNILIELNGAGGGNANGLVLQGGSSIVRGLVINRFQQNAIWLTSKGDNVVAGNFIGTDPTGQTALGNGSGVVANAPDNRIGGPNLADRNVVSGNLNDGIFSGPLAKGTLIQGNRIGVNAAGFAALGNGRFGVHINEGTQNLIGGDDEGERNVISANGDAGLLLIGSNGNTVLGNYIGTGQGGVNVLGNGSQGIRLENSSSNVIGANFPDHAYNVIAANGDAGIRIASSSDNNRIEGNFVGTNSDGLAGLGNIAAGVHVFNGTGNRITFNAIANNGGLGINLDGGVTPVDGVTPNDLGDPDTGPNNLQNFPDITSAVRSGTSPFGNPLVNIQGALNSTPNTEFRIEFFASSSCDPTRNGEGQRVMTTTAVTTGVDGNAPISVTTSVALLSDQFITATATDPSGNTSEFSLCVPISDTTPSPTPTPTPTATPTPTPSPAPSTLQFGQAVYSVIEDCTEVVFSVSRTGDVSAAATVDYLAQPGTASDRSDFTTALGTLNFASGVTAVSFVVLIHEDSLTEGTETASVILSNPKGATLGQPSSATLEIFDDPSEPAKNANDVSEQFVCQHYHDFLNRMPDVEGLNFWTNQIEQCGGNAACVQAMRIQVSAAFFLSIEFQETGFFVIRTQRVAFGKKSDSAATRMTYLQFIRDARAVGDGVVVGLPGWEQQLEVNRRLHAARVVASVEFITRYPLALTAGEYVDALFASAGVMPTAIERQDAITAFGAGGAPGRAAALRSVADSQSLRDAEFRGAFVLMQYFGYLRRNPSDAPDSDDSGYQFWLAKLNQFNGNYIQAEMVKSFIISSEYRQRFGQP